MKNDLDITIVFVLAAVGYAFFIWMLEGWLK
jgi:hypothetical protein